MNSYAVNLVTESAEMDLAVKELTSGDPTDYVVLRVAGSEFGNANRAQSPRTLIETEGFLARQPDVADFEALETGRTLLARETFADEGGPS